MISVVGGSHWQSQHLNLETTELLPGIHQVRTSLYQWSSSLRMLLNTSAELDEIIRLAKQNTMRWGLLLEHSSSKMMGTSNANIKHRFKARRELCGNPWGLLELNHLINYYAGSVFWRVCIKSASLDRTSFNYNTPKAAYAGVSVRPPWREVFSAS